MYTLLKSKSTIQILEEAPALLFSLVLAETFYKLGSFSLELFAFFGTWYLLSKTIFYIKKKFK